MLRKFSVFISVFVMLALALGIPTVAALAGSVTQDGVSVGFPGNANTCTPSGSVTIALPDGATAQVYLLQHSPSFAVLNPPYGQGIGPGGSVTLSFPYPVLTPGVTYQFGVDVHYTLADGTTGEIGNATTKWTVTCAEPTTPPPPTPTPTTPPPPTPTPTPPPGLEGCTPGYWRNHLQAWAATGYSTSADFDTTFGVNYFTPDITLGQAIQLGGGGYNPIARHGTAALLSASHSGVDYPYTVAQVIAFVQANDKDTLEAANELGCPLN